MRAILGTVGFSVARFDTGHHKRTPVIDDAKAMVIDDVRTIYSAQVTKRVEVGCG
jgi:hypothetical protein